MIGRQTTAFVYINTSHCCHTAEVCQLSRMIGHGSLLLSTHNNYLRNSSESYCICYFIYIIYSQHNTINSTVNIILLIVHILIWKPTNEYAIAFSFIYYYVILYIHILCGQQNHCRLSIEAGKPQHHDKIGLCSVNTVYFCFECLQVGHFCMICYRVSTRPAQVS